MPQIPRKIAVLANRGQQQSLFPIKKVTVEGMDMGVLNDGTPFLHLRGVARMCGVDAGLISRLANDWSHHQLRPRGRTIKRLLDEHGYEGDELVIRADSNGTAYSIFVDAVCMALLEYYAFEAGNACTVTAQKSFRLLARESLRNYIYKRCGFDPNAQIPQAWLNFQHRVLLNDQIPANYFSVFREMADLVVHLIRAGCPIDDETVPDISVGSTWGRYWVANDFDRQFSARVKHPHRYPDWFRQSQAGPVPAWIYPIEAIGEFRIWLQNRYLPDKFPVYLDGKVKKGHVLPRAAQAVLTAVDRPRLG